MEQLVAAHHQLAVADQNRGHAMRQHLVMAGTKFGKSIAVRFLNAVSLYKSSREAEGGFVRACVSP
jgi:hypothetical protein